MTSNIMVQSVPICRFISQFNWTQVQNIPSLGMLRPFPFWLVLYPLVINFWHIPLDNFTPFLNITVKLFQTFLLFVQILSYYCRPVIRLWVRRPRFIQPGHFLHDKPMPES